MTEGAPESTGIVFVNYHSESLIGPRAVRLAADGYRVVVADNSDTFPDGAIPRISMGGNQGFAVACNRATKALPPEVTAVCFHNPDVDCSAIALRHLRRALDAQSRPGAVAPAERVGALIRDRGYRYPGAVREVFLALRLVLLWRLGRASSPPGTGGRTRLRGGGGRRFAGGGLLMVSRAAHDAIGGFDERFFLYMEDLDYWHRLGQGGFQTEFEPGVVILHALGTGSPITAIQREVLRWVGVELFKEITGGHWRAYRLIHRAVLKLVPSPTPPLVEQVRSRWNARATPLSTSAAIRAFARQHTSEPHRP